MTSHEYKAVHIHRATFESDLNGICAEGWEPIDFESTFNDSGYRLVVFKRPVQVVTPAPPVEKVAALIQGAIGRRQDLVRELYLRGGMGFLAQAFEDDIDVLRQALVAVTKRGET